MMPRWPVFTFLLLISLPACKSREWKQSLITARAPLATYIEHREKDGKLVPQGFAHPPKLPEDSLKAIFRGLKYHPTGFMGAARIINAAPIFTDEEAALLAGPVSRDLEKLGPDERLRFLLTRTSWKPFAMGAKGTSAVIFFDTPERMNLAFDFIDESLSDDTGNPRAMVFNVDPVAITGKEPVIVPPPGGFLRLPAPDGEAHPQWVVLDPRLIPVATEPAAAPAAGPTAPRPAAPSAEESAEAVKRKLKVLDDLRKDGVINAEEYEKARQEILLQRGR